MHFKTLFAEMFPPHRQRIMSTIVSAALCFAMTVDIKGLLGKVQLKPPTEDSPWIKNKTKKALAVTQSIQL